MQGCMYPLDHQCRVQTLCSDSVTDLCTDASLDLMKETLRELAGEIHHITLRSHTHAQTAVHSILLLQSSSTTVDLDLGVGGVGVIAAKGLEVG